MPTFLLTQNPQTKSNMKSFRNFLKEGNPLSRLKTHIDSGRHFVTLSASRANLSKKENDDRHVELKKKVAKQGYAYRDVEGHYDAQKEKSLMVHAKGTGAEHGAKLRDDMIEHGKHYDQDSILHHDGTKATLHGTNETGHPGLGKTDTIGKVKYNPNKAPNQTELRPGKRHTSASFTTEEFVEWCLQLLNETPVEKLFPNYDHPFDGATMKKTYVFI
jgi:hypothetical protein